jgi:hypothetical protein
MIRSVTGLERLGQLAGDEQQGRRPAGVLLDRNRPSVQASAARGVMAGGERREAGRTSQTVNTTPRLAVWMSGAWCSRW